jgi:hypothetical protein
MADLALGDQLDQGANDALDRCRPVNAVPIVEVEVVGTEALVDPSVSSLTLAAQLSTEPIRETVRSPSRMDFMTPARA